ncbi:hypothetical protein CDL15_Pgr017798 [Punica granatum]|uniref:Uncharacterized protein n=1 Tax=Punica granatum TaxID=22663 RepID=A0A218WGG0_PUNGR|nr:hypothetical protein CDL15_Pgr017798 [Punica granatum]
MTPGKEWRAHRGFLDVAARAMNDEDVRRVEQLRRFAPTMAGTGRGARIGSSAVVSWRNRNDTLPEKKNENKKEQKNATAQGGTGMVAP